MLRFPRHALFNESRRSPLRNAQHARHVAEPFDIKDVINDFCLDLDHSRPPLIKSVKRVAYIYAGMQ